MKEFNLLISTSRGFERAAVSELHFLLEEIGDSSPNVWRTSVSGLIAAATTLNPFEAIEKLRRILAERPYEFRYALRCIPIERVVQSNLTEIQKAVTELSSKMTTEETFRVTVEKRFTSFSTREIIETVASKIRNKVDLEKPDETVLIEIVGSQTGISIVKRNGILSVQKEKLL